MTPEEELLDGPNAHIAAAEDPRSLYSVHDNEAQEKDGTDEAGLQGGQDYNDPTTQPTPAPTVAPTKYPTYAPTNPPTKQGQKYVIMGTTWYDRNANGIRDSNVEVAGLGSDVEFSHAVSGINVELIECDPSNGREYIPPDGDVVDTYANVITAGLGGRGEAQIVKRSDSDGRYKIVVIKGLQRHYYIKVDTPNEFLITTGACNDDVRGFECDYSTAVQDVVSDARALSVDAPQRDLNAASAFAVSSASAPRPLGIRSGRSERCVYVDSEGNVEFNIDFGIMKVDDSRTVDTNVALLLEFDEEAVPESPSLRGRSLEAMLNRATVLGESRDGTLTTTRYLLGDDDKLAIGTVTAEILASSLDKRLEANGIELDDVTPKEVVVSRSKDSSKSERKASELAVAMQIKGHYNPPPDLDFDFIVQDSINRDTPEIRRNLREYNDNCRDQSSNTQAGYTEEDYSTVVSTTGAGRPVGRGGSRGSTLPQLGGSASFSKACSSNKVLPIYFETSLKEIEAKSIREVRVGGDEMIIFANEDRALEGWAMGPVAAIAGLIALLVGAFVFRRAIGPRRVDKYKESNKTKEVDMFETSRFGEGGGDDSSVDSDFYSDDEEDEKGRKISRKLKDKEDMDAKAKGRSSRRDIEKGSSKRASASALRSSLTKGTMSLRKSKQSTDGFAPEDKMSKRKKRASRAKLAASEGSNSTDSLDKGSNSSTEMDRDEQLKRSEKRNKRRSKINEDGSERKSKSEKRRGRSSRVGGDNSKLFEDSIEAEIL